MLLFAALALCSCTEESESISTLQQYHLESLALGQVSADSVARFQQKVAAYIAQNPAAADDPVCEAIRQNIRQNFIRLKIELNPEWDGIDTYDFDGRPISDSPSDEPLPIAVPQAPDEADANDAV